ncbi:MAG: preprotein translocase subunit SecE [Candidatus Peribacteraceae bacterium]|jgi:preprotein translocase SecE subunit
MISPLTYIDEALEELHQVRWPTRHQAVRFSAIVLGFVLLSAFVFGVVDFGLSQIVTILLPTA